MEAFEVKYAAENIKPADIAPWVAEKLATLPKEAKPKTYTGRWSKGAIEKWLVERYAATNNPGSVKMSCCNMLRAAIKRVGVKDGSKN